MLEETTVPVFRVGCGVVWGSEEQRLVAATRTGGYNEALRRAVADSFPMKPSENTKEWAGRVLASGLNKSQRAMLAAETWIASRDVTRAQSVERNTWVRAARAGFQRPHPQPCLLCGEWEEFTECHHIFPLGWQFDFGLEVANHEVAWLCADHHRDVHDHLKEMVYHPLKETASLRLPGDRGKIVGLLLRYIQISDWRADPWHQIQGTA